MSIYYPNIASGVLDERCDEATLLTTLTPALLITDTVGTQHDTIDVSRVESFSLLLENTGATVTDDVNLEFAPTASGPWEVVDSTTLKGVAGGSSKSIVFSNNTREYFRVRGKVGAGTTTIRLYLSGVMRSIVGHSQSSSGAAAVEYEGVLNAAADFPTKSSVEVGDLYLVGTNVTDNDASKTNTGLSFLVNDEIMWDGVTWQNLGALRKHASDHTDGTDDIQDATNAQKGLATAAQITALEGLQGQIRATETADGPIGARRLVSVDPNGDHVESGIDATNCVGINAENAAKVPTDPIIVSYAGKVTGVAADTIDEGRPLKSYAGGRVGEMVDLSKTGTVLGSNAGIGFINQPANDGVELVSDNAGDTQNATVYYTRNGQGDAVFSETVVLTGTTFVPLTDTDVELVLGVELDSPAVGTITVREASGDLTITTIGAAATQSGVIDIPTADQRAFGIPPEGQADAATTKQLGIVGISSSDLSTTIMSSVILDGPNPVSFATNFHRVTKLLVGDVENARTATVIVGLMAEDRERRVGKSIGSAAAQEDPVVFNLQV